MLRRIAVAALLVLASAAPAEAAVERREAIAEELANLREELRGVEAEWMAEKEQIEAVRSLKEEIEAVRSEAERAQRDGGEKDADGVVHFTAPLMFAGRVRWPAFTPMRGGQRIDRRAVRQADSGDLRAGREARFAPASGVKDGRDRVRGAPHILEP